MYFRFARNFIRILDAMRWPIPTAMRTHGQKKPTSTAFISREKRGTKIDTLMHDNGYAIRKRKGKLRTKVAMMTSEITPQKVTSSGSR